MSIFNLIKMERNLDKGVSKVLARCGQSSVFVPLLASCCAVLMCASSCNKSDNGNTGKNRLGTHDAANTEDSGATHSTSLGNSGLADSVDSTSLIDSVTDVKSGQWYLLRKLPVDLIKDGKHYDIHLNGEKILPEVFGAFVLRSFLLPGKNVDNVKRAIDDLPLKEQGVGLQKSDVMLNVLLITSTYFDMLNDFNFSRKIDQPNSTSVPLEDDAKVVISCYIADVLFSLVRNHKYDNASFIFKKFKKSCLRSYRDWMKEYAVDDKGSFGINEACACLGQDIIDELGAQKDNGDSSYIPRFDREGSKNANAGKRWFLLDEVSLGSGLFKKVDTIYIASDTKTQKSKNMSFGFQTIAELAKYVLCRNFGPLSTV